MSTRTMKSELMKPPGLKGLALFDHMVEFRMRFHDEPTTPSIDVEMTDDQRQIIAPKAQDLTVRAILKDAGGAGATKKLARRKLNNTGAITNHCGLQNHPERINKLLGALQLTASIAQIHAGAIAAKEAAKKNGDFELMSMAYPALMKLHLKKNNVDALNKKEICAISFRYFLTMLKAADKKTMLVKTLQELMIARPNVIPEAVAQPNDLPAALPAVAYRASASSSDEESNEENDEFEV